MTYSHPETPTSLASANILSGYVSMSPSVSTRLWVLRAGYVSVSRKGLSSVHCTRPGGY